MSNVDVETYRLGYTKSGTSWDLVEYYQDSSLETGKVYRQVKGR